MKQAGRSLANGSAPHRDAGIVLLLVLIILVVLSSAAIWAAKAALSGEKVSNNLRSSASAQELAELALRYCEDGAIKDPSAMVVLEPPTNGASSALPDAWSQLANWQAGAGKTNTVPPSQLKDALGNSPAKAPVCMIESMRLAPVDMQRLQGYLITGRGFTPDYVEASNGAIESGADAWVQSLIRF